MKCYYVDSTDVCRCSERACDHMASQSECRWYEPEYIPTLTPYTWHDIAIDSLYGTGMVALVVSVVLILSQLLRYFV